MSKAQDDPPPKRKGGRPRVEIDLDQVKELAAIGCTDDEIAVFFKVSKQTIMTRKAEEAFLNALNEGRNNRKMSLRRAQTKAALAGSIPMLIWLGKNDLGQVDRQEHTIGTISDELIKKDLDRLRAENARHALLAREREEEQGK
jgi:hypothetical protein